MMAPIKPLGPTFGSRYECDDCDWVFEPFSITFPVGATADDCDQLVLQANEENKAVAQKHWDSHGGES